MGKGDKRRPMQCQPDQYEASFEAIFGKKKPWWKTREHDEWCDEALKIKKEAEKNESKNRE